MWYKAVNGGVYLMVEANESCHGIVVAYIVQPSIFSLVFNSWHEYVNVCWSTIAMYL